MNILKNFSANFKKGLQKLNFRGRSSRKEILQIAVFTPITIIFGFFIMTMISFGLDSKALMGGTLFLVGAALFLNALASICAVGRRFQDMNLSGWFALPFIFLSPAVYLFLSLFLLILPSSKNNKYGPNLEGWDISSEAVENYIYYKYFEANPYHEGMTPELSTAHNKKQAEIYLKLIPAEDKIEFDKLMSFNIRQKVDFSKELPILGNQIKENDFVNKHQLQNIDYNKLFSEMKAYAHQTHNKEING